jgi:alkylation response protein AidB-like acyl-CoA dehydrogenase
MDLTLQADEAQVAAMAAEVLAKEAPLERWFTPTTRPAVEEDRLRVLAAGLGWIGFGAPEAAGGSEASPVDEAVLFREVGRGLGPICLIAGAAAARIVAPHDVDLAVRIVGGEAAVGLAASRDAGSFWRLGASDGDLGLVVEGRRLMVVAFGGLAAETCLDPTVTAQSAAREDMWILAEADSAEALRFGLLVAAQQLGLAEAALAASVAYAKLREQFGRPIGGLQAVRHRCVDMLVRCERAKAQLWFAAVSLRDGAADAAFQVAVAMWTCDQAAGANARDNILLHGAIGATAEHAAHLFLKRSMLWRQVTPQTEILEGIASGTGPPFQLRQNASTRNHLNW